MRAWLYKYDRPLACAVWFLLFALLMHGCATGRPDSIKELGERNAIFKGKVVGAPDIIEGGRRILVYVHGRRVNFDEEDLDEEAQIITAIAENMENKNKIADLNASLLATPADKPVFLYGDVVEGQWNDHLTGIDFEILAAGIFVDKAKDYKITFPGYGNRWYDAISWGNFLRVLTKQGWRMVKP